MRKILALLCILFCTSIASAQQFSKHSVPELTRYVYCEIIANHLPTTGKPVLLDFGQKTNPLSYNKLCDEKGEKLKFNSGIEALNYMVSRDWEFVQAYTSGETHDNLHYLLRMPIAQLSDEWRQVLAPSSDEAIPPQKEK